MAKKKKMFPETRSKASNLYVPSFISHLAQPEVIGTIQGKSPGSKEEWRVSVALDEMGAKYDYQYIVGANRPAGARGIFKLDFLIYGNPKKFGLEIQSERWHSAQFNPNEDFRIVYIESKMKIEIYYLWEYDLKDQRTATESVRDLVGRFL